MQIVFTAEGICCLCVMVGASYYISPSQMLVNLAEAPHLRKIYQDIGSLIIGETAANFAPQQTRKERAWGSGKHRPRNATTCAARVGIEYAL